MRDAVADANLVRDLQAEVERLRAECASTEPELQRLRGLIFEHCETEAKLRADMHDALAERTALRAENAELDQANIRALKLVDDVMKDNTKLEAENAEANEGKAHLAEQLTHAIMRMNKAEAENAELRGLVCQHGDGTRPEADEQDIANLKRWKQRVEALKATLDWFEALVQSLRKQPDPWLEEWLREYDLEHPRPGS